MTGPGERAWEEVQAEFADIPGARGIELRQQAYRPFFARFGRDVRIDERCRFVFPQRIVLDDDVRINVEALIYGSGGVRIGRHCRIGPRCFIHSANHDVADGPDAYFERGYRYERTIIGDNTLISANVSILPGAELGTGCFVAAGALVTKGRYEPGARLVGVPARPRPASPPVESRDAASIALVTPQPGLYAEAALHLLTRLGLPDVVHRYASDPVPPTVHTTVAIGPEGWEPPESWPNVWSLARGSDVVEGPASLRGFAGREPFEATVPREQKHVFVPSSTLRDESELLPTVTRTVCYYAIKRLTKQELSRQPQLASAGGVREAPAEPALDARAAGEAVGTAVLRMVARQFEFPAGDEMWARLLEGAEDEGVRPAKQRSLVPHRLARELALRIAPHIRAMAPALRDAATSSRDTVLAIDDNPQWLLCHRVLARHLIADPEDASDPLVEASQRLSKVAGLRWLVLAYRGRRARTLAYLAFLSYLRGDARILDVVLSRMQRPPLLSEDAAIIRSTVNSGGYCYDPVLAALLLVAYAGPEARDPKVAQKSRTPPVLPSIQRTATGVFSWDGFAKKATALRIHKGDQGFAMIDPRNRLISRSLLENWLAAHGAPPIDSGEQFELTPNCYAPLPLYLRDAWLAVFRHLQHAQDRPFIRILPWPAPYRWAMSLRYDVDRAITAQQAQHVLNLQRQWLGAACAAWYDFPEAKRAWSRSQLVERSLQEVAVHAWRPEDAAPGVGVTCHSAPGSAYWAAERSLRAAEANDAAYAEMLSTQLGLPGPAWLREGDGGGRRSGVWVLPIHFPLEGTTSDTSLQYFDRLLNRFRELRERGGHVIVGSHPDLNQQILGQLVEREGLDGAWCATPLDVVERCRRLFDPGAVRLVFNEQDEPCLVAREHLSDVQLVIEPPGESSPKCVVAQLNAGQPRPIDDLPEVAAACAPAADEGAGPAVNPPPSPGPAESD